MRENILMVVCLPKRVNFVWWCTTRFLTRCLAISTLHILENELAALEPVAWPLSTLEFNPLDSVFWESFTSLLYEASIKTLSNLMATIAAAAKDITNIPGTLFDTLLLHTFFDTSSNRLSLA
ncbi:hypothetical protein CDAR_404401 [Caerostris darwini]|uniref:Uncharacterized protein n=1 Tax=Caerostris darwini TaxID=1538125 RepID=A0AAV4SRC7_9ARAC|nr:hypothetical protein CDAR_404401 [Caerostris darwini]